MADSSRDGPSLTALFVKIVVGAGWMLGGAYASAILMRETSRTEDMLAALFLIAAPVVWCALKARAVARSDEMEGKVKAEGLSHGLMFGNVWVGVSTGAIILSSLFLGAGEVNVSGLQQLAVTFLCTQPAMAFLISEATSFTRLRKYAKREG